MARLNMVDPLVTTAWLAEWIDDPEVQILDATWYMPGHSASAAETYAEAHIPGAVRFDIDELSDTEADLPHMLPTPRAFAKAAGALGLRRDCILVVYDAQGLFSAPRVWWTLRVMGFPEVFVLDGGLKKWRAEGRPVSQTSHHFTAAKLSVRNNERLVRDLEDVQALLGGRDVQIVDARPEGRFRGEAPEPRAGLRSGHMPGALNLPWDSLVNPDGTLKVSAELRNQFKAARVDPDAPVVATCGSGVSAALVALALARLGRSQVPIYDGAWTEWGGRADTAVVTGA